MISKLICWWKGKHDWTDWFDVIYLDGRTKYWMRTCLRCGKEETAYPEKPK